MTEGRLLDTDGSPANVRRFLYHTLRLSELYTGDGFTRTFDNRRGVAEYIMLNRRLNELKDSRIYALDIRLPRQIPGVVTAI